MTMGIPCESKSNSEKFDSAFSSPQASVPNDKVTRRKKIYFKWIDVMAANYAFVIFSTIAITPSGLFLRQN